VVLTMCWPWMAACKTLLGLLTMACVTPVSPAPEVRNWVLLVSVCSSKSISLPVPGWPMGKGLMLVLGMVGAAFAVLAVPWARIVVPCGIEASRHTVGSTLGSVVCGTAA